MATLGSLSDAEKELLKKKKEEQGDYDVSTDYLTIAEFGLYFGFDGIRAIVNNEIKDLGMVIELIKAARKLKGIK